MNTDISYSEVRYGQRQQTAAAQKAAPKPPGPGPVQSSRIQGRFKFEPLQQRTVFSEFAPEDSRIPWDCVDDAIAQIKIHIRRGERYILNVEPVILRWRDEQSKMEGYRKPEVPVAVYVSGGAPTMFAFDTVGPFGGIHGLRDYLVSQEKA